MGGSDGTRAVSEVMGGILVFSLLVTALGAYQAVIVPNTNEKIEFKHSNQVQQDFIDLRNSIHRSSTDGEDTSVAVDLGVDYPTRSLTINPPEQGGTLQGVTTDGSSTALAVENATAIDGEVDDYWNDTTREFSTGRVVYTPAYNIYRNAPQTVVENGIIYNKFGAGEPDIPLSSQRVVSGRQISLVMIDSDLSKSQADTLAVDVNAVSAGSTEIAVTNASSGDNVTVRIPTNLSEKVWVGQLLADQIDGAGSGDTTCSEVGTSGDDDPNRFIHDCTYTSNSEFSVLALEMERNETYTLKLSKVSVGKSVAAPGPHYVVPLEGNDVSVPENGKQRLALQVRDRFNNPVSGATVNLSLDPATQGTLVIDGKSKDSFSNVRTNEEGKVIATYKASDAISGSPTAVDVKASYETDTSVSPWDSDTRQNTTFDLHVINASKINRTQPLFNPEQGVIVRAANFTSEGCTPGGGISTCHLNVVFENTAGEPRTLTKGRYVFYTGDSQGNAPSDPSGLAVLKNTNPDTELIFGGETKQLSPSIQFSPGEQKTIEFKVYEGETTSSDEISISEGEYFVFSFIIDNTKRETYFVAPADGT